ncbi:PA2169 family four-helix-bundle protein [Hymenobacter properus]|uniref:PA2169 family four-helix-bundle protein n=1 Tax=Hymenobacter properus TaxID=2791026 RepID=A0A931FL41_9BACT|nr:PA2169 family four-helix-bundle protein [Hymenobacter properus]MBF9140339.1 PA2169 family four-helix-bundle protein [Hymenobacter properus]MBR7719146.1 PA2169 family four-helix-bundle protein [Microvirga sp. SRT04]
MATTNNSTAAFSELLAIAHTGAKGYQEAAEGASNPQIKAELSHLSQQRAQFESQLQQQASRLGVAGDATGSIEAAVTEAAAAVHRGWINLKSAITGQSDAAILGECETGDATALTAYETALKADLPAEVRSVVEQQHGQILAAKNKITLLKGQAK